MKHRFLLHSLSHRILAVDITREGLPFGPSTATEPNTVPILRFGSWEHAAAYFRSLGADETSVDNAGTWLQKAGAATLTILQTY